MVRRNWGQVCNDLCKVQSRKNRVGFNKGGGLTWVSKKILKTESRNFLKKKVVGTSSTGRGGAAYTKSGIPDLLVCCNGHFLGVEVKAPKGKPSELQLYNIRKINEACGIGIVLYPDQFDDFKYMLQCLIDGHDMEAWQTAKKINERV